MDAFRKSLVILNGSKPPQTLVQEFWNKVDCRICADGAANTLMEYELNPDVIIGDLDSTPANFKQFFTSSEILRDPDQYSTDGEKALNYCVKHKYLDITILGALGLRFDHALYNISLLKVFSSITEHIKIYSNEDKVFLIDQHHTLHEPLGTRISLMPVFGEVSGVETKGLKYPLAGETLAFGAFCSISNQIDKDTASIRIGGGQLLVVIQR